MNISLFYLSMVFVCVCISKKIAVSIGFTAIRKYSQQLITNADKQAVNKTENKSLKTLFSVFVIIVFQLSF